MALTFYSICIDDKTKSAKVVRNYINGYYLDERTGKKETIPKCVNKYNEYFLNNFRYIHDQFCGIELAFKVAIDIIKNRGIAYSNYIAKLSKSVTEQKYAVKFNRLIQAGLKKYSVASRQIYNSIETSLKLQNNMAIQNKELVEKLYASYGMENILGLVEEFTGMKLIEHCSNFVKGMPILKDLGKDDVLAKIVDEYIKYLEGIARDKGISLYDSLSEPLDIDDKGDNEKSKVTSKRDEQRKLREKLSNILQQDSIRVESEINSLKSIIESRKVGKKFTVVTALRMYDKIQNMYGYVWYIAMTKGNGVIYAGESTLISDSIVGARLFRNFGSAHRHLKSIRADLEGYRTEIVKILIYKPEKSRDEFDVAKYVQLVLRLPNTVEDRMLCKNVVEGALGMFADSGSGDGYIYVCHDSKIGLVVLCSNLNGELVLGHINYNLVVKPVTGRYNKSIRINSGNRQLVFECEKVHFDCKLYQRKIDILQEYNRSIHNILSEDMESWQGRYDLKSINTFKRIRERVNSTVGSGSSRVCYIIGVSIHSDSDVVYCRESNSKHYTEALSRLDLFESYVKAINMCKLLNSREETWGYVWRIFDIV